MRPLSAVSCKRGAADASPARRAVSVSGGVGWSARSMPPGAVVRVLGWSLFGAYVRQGLPWRRFAIDYIALFQFAHARARRSDLATMYILSQGIARLPGCFSSLFELSEARGALISSPLPLFPSKKLPLPHFLHLHSLKHITMPLSLKISPAIEFLSFGQANYALNPKQTLLRDFKGIIRNQRGTAQSTTY